MQCRLLCGISYRSNSYPPLRGRLPTRYSPVRNSSARCKHQASAFYLHVLGTPPAFVLSQDQTLIKKFEFSLISVTDRFIVFFIVQYYNLSCSALHIGSSCSVFKGLCHSLLSSDNYISISQLLFLVNTFLKLFLNFFHQVFQTTIYHSPYGIRTRVTAVKRRCLNPLTNGPELLFSTLTIIPTF